MGKCSYLRIVTNNVFLFGRDIVIKLGLARTTISQDIKEIKNARILKLAYESKVPVIVWKILLSIKKRTKIKKLWCIFYQTIV